MADIDIVLERLVTDAAFRTALADDPAAALASYALSDADLRLLASSLDDGDRTQRGVEQRTSKSAMVGLLASLTGGGATGPGDTGKYSAPVNMTSSARAGGPDGPALDGASKDAAHLHQGAPPSSDPHDGTARPPKEWNPSTPQLRSSAQPPEATAPPDDGRGSDGDRRWQPTRLEVPDVAVDHDPDPEAAPPPGDVDGDGYWHTIKIPNTRNAVAPPDLDRPDDFLTVEDE